MSISRIEYVAKTLGNKAVNVFLGDRTISLAIRNDVRASVERVERERLERQLNNEPELPKDTITNPMLMVIDQMCRFDPSPNYQYLLWITKRYIDLDFRHEDYQRVKQELSEFEKYKPRLKRDGVDIDINHYKSAADVFQIIKKYRDDEQATSKREEVRREYQRYFDERKALLFYESDTMRVVIPVTQQASCFFGRGTRWCTAASHSYNAFDSYNRQGPLYIIMVGSEKYQFHFQTAQFTNELDRVISLPQLIKKFPELKEAFDTVATEMGLIPLMKHVTSDGLYNALVNSYKDHDFSFGDSRDYSGVGELLQAVDRSVQDSRIALYAVEKDTAAALKFVRPDLQQLPEFQRIVIEKRPELLQSINPKAQTLELVETVLKKSPTMLRYVRPDLMTTDLLCMAVKKQPQVLGQVPRDKQSIDVIRAAFKATPNMNVKRMLINMVHDTSLRKQLSETLREAVQ